MRKSPPSADHMTRRAKCIRNAMRVVIQLWGRALTFSTSLNFYAFNVRETAGREKALGMAWRRPGQHGEKLEGKQIIRFRFSMECYK